MTASRARVEWAAVAASLEDSLRTGEVMVASFERVARERDAWKRDCLSAEAVLGRLESLVMQLSDAHPDEPGLEALRKEVRRLQPLTPKRGEP